VLTNAVNVTKNGQCVGFFFNTVSAKAAGTVTLNSAVTVRKETTISESETACTTETFKSKSLSITVKSMSPVVETITVSQKDRIALKDNASLYYEKKSDEQQIVLNVSAQDFADESFETLYATKGESAKLQWSTSNKKVAYVSATESSTKLIIPKNASGVAKITVKSGTNASAQMTFNVVVYDTDVRLDTTKVALNSYSDTSGTIYLYPNIILADQAQTAESQSSDENDENGETEAQPDYKIDIQPVKQTIVNKKVVGYEADTRFEVSDYDLSSGTVQIRFADSAVNTKKGSYTVYLKITQTVKGSELDPVYKKITVTNTPSVPKATVKVLKTYNQFLGQNAVLQVTTSAELKKAVNLTDVIKLNADGGKYEIANITKTAANQYQVELQATSAVASLKVGKTSKSNVSVTVGYANYRKASQSASVNVTVENKAPTLSLSAYQPKNATIYSKLDNTIQVLLTLPTEVKAADVYQEYQSNAGILQLTSAVQKEKKFKISQVALAEDSNALIVTLTSLSGKSGSVQFTLGKVAPLTGSVTSGKLTINVKNVNTMKLSMQDTTTGKSATTYTLRQMSAGKEVLNLKAILSDSSIDYSTSVYAADTFTDNALKSKALVLVKSDDGKSFQVKATAALFKLITKKNNSCKLKFTAYSGNVALNSATVTLKLDTTAEKKVAIKVSLKASGTLNVVDPASTVTITPTFTNVPLGATIKEVSFTDTADVNRYDKKVNEQTGKLTLSLHRNEDGSYASIPTGKDSIGLKYKILQVDGTYRELTASTTITVAQTATVKANQTSLTLYNVATGISYGKTVTLNVTKAGNASVKSISISGLSGSGISWKQDTDTPNRITFYVDPVQNRGIDGKTYTANLTVTLNGAGTKSGKIITYNVPVKINLAK
jgi:hypothetical protein